MENNICSLTDKPCDCTEKENCSVFLGSDSDFTGVDSDKRFAEAEEIFSEEKVCPNPESDSPCDGCNGCKYPDDFIHHINEN